MSKTEHEKPEMVDLKEKTLVINPAIRPNDEVVFYLDGKWQKGLLKNRPALSDDEHSVALEVINDPFSPHAETVVVKNSPRKVAFRLNEKTLYNGAECIVTETWVSPQGEILYTLTTMRNGRHINRVSESKLVTEKMMGRYIVKLDSKAARIDEVRANLVGHIAEIKGKKRIEFMAKFHEMLKRIEALKEDVDQNTNKYYKKETYTNDSQILEELKRLEKEADKLPIEYETTLVNLYADVKKTLEEEKQALLNPPPAPDDKEKKDKKSDASDKKKKVESPVFDFETEKGILQTNVRDLLKRTEKLNFPHLLKKLNDVKKGLDSFDFKKRDAQKEFIFILRQLHDTDLDLLRLENFKDKKDKEKDRETKKIIDIPQDLMEKLLELRQPQAHLIMEKAFELALKGESDLRSLEVQFEYFFTSLAGLFVGDASEHKELKKELAEHDFYPENYTESFPLAVLQALAKNQVALAKEQKNYWMCRELHQIRGDNRSDLDLWIDKDTNEKEIRREEKEKTSMFSRMKGAVVKKWGLTLSLMAGAGIVTRSLVNHIPYVGTFISDGAMGAIVGGVVGLTKVKAQEIGDKWVSSEVKEAKKGAKKSKEKLISDHLMSEIFEYDEDGLPIFKGRGRREMAHLFSTSLRRATVSNSEKIVKLENKTVELNGEQELAICEILKSAELEEGLIVPEKIVEQLKRAVYTMRNNKRIPAPEFLPAENSVEFGMRWLSETLQSKNLSKASARYAWSGALGASIGFAFNATAHSAPIRTALGGYAGYQRGHRSQFESETGDADFEARKRIKTDAVELERLLAEPTDSLDENEIERMREYRDLFSAMLNAKNTKHDFHHIDHDVFNFYQKHSWDVAGLLQRDKDFRLKLESLLDTIERSRAFLRQGFRKALLDIQTAGAEQEDQVENTWGVRWGRFAKRVVRGTVYGTAGALASYLLGLAIDKLREPVEPPAGPDPAAVKAQAQPEFDVVREDASKSTSQPLHQPPTQHEVVVPPPQELPLEKTFVSAAYNEARGLVDSGQMKPNTVIAAAEQWFRANPYSSFDDQALQEFKTWIFGDKLEDPSSVPTRINGRYIPDSEDRFEIYRTFMSGRTEKPLVVIDDEKPYIDELEEPEEINAETIIPPTKQEYSLEMKFEGDVSDHFTFKYSSAGINRTFAIDASYNPAIDEGNGQYLVIEWNIAGKMEKFPGTVTFDLYEGKEMPVFNYTGPDGAADKWLIRDGRLDVLLNGEALRPIE